MAERGIIFKDDFVTAPDKSWFDMSFDFLLSGNFGELIPTTCMECMPEDKIHAKSDSFVRLAPLVSPTFGKVNMFDYHFYVRNRSIWTQWESFIADKDQRKSWQQANPLWTPPEMPYIDIRNVLYNGLTVNSFDLAQAPEFDSLGDHFYSVEDKSYNGYSVSYLVLGANFNSDGEIRGVTSYISDNKRMPIDMNLDADAYYIIPFVRNKNEMTDMRPWYNPFSAGSLFDYLGVDLSGMYSHNENWLASLDSAFAADDALYKPFFNLDLDIVTTAAQIDTSHINVEDITKAGWYPVEINIREFLRTHCVLGTIIFNTSQYYFALPDAHLYHYDASSGTPSWSAVTSTGILDLTREEETAKINALPLRAYHSIYIDYFRDQNYISVNPCIDFSRDGNDIDWSQGVSNVFDYLTLNYKAYEHDPYTSALPQAQRGEPVRYLPDAKLVSSSNVTNTIGEKYGTLMLNTSTGNVFRNTESTFSGTSSLPSVVVDLSAATIENLRFANALQKLKEREARSGGRYFELMEAIFGARIDDAKVDRPIFLGGDKTPIQVSEVLQTSATEVTSDQPLGQMAGRAVAIGNDDFIEYVTPDHGFFIEICAVLPRTNYQQGLLPMFTRKVRLDYPMPQFAQLGETQVPQSELWYSADESEDKKPFGYQSRYYDSKYQRDRTSGSFKDALAHWTWSRIFDNAPLAGKAFIEVHPDYRQFAVTDKSQEHVYIHMWHDIQVLRSLPVFGTPKL